MTTSEEVLNKPTLKINEKYTCLVPKISDSEFEGPVLDPYRQVGISGDTRAIYNELIASKDRRLRRRVRSIDGILSDTHRSTVTDAFRRGNSNQKVTGKSGVIEAFTRADKDKNEILGKQRHEKLREAINADQKKPRKQADNTGIGKINEADLLVNIAEKQILLLCKSFESTLCRCQSAHTL